MNLEFYYYICNQNKHSNSKPDMEENFATRLKLFIDTNGMTSSQFADMCGIPRPSLSQVLSGRNKKISDALVKQIHDAFPDLSVLWLMFGEGPVKVSSSASSSHQISQTGSYNKGSGSVEVTEGANSGFENSINPHGVSANRNNQILGGLESGDSKDNPSKNQIFESDLRILDLQRQIANMRQNPRRVVQITIYYDDSTFETFVPRG